MTIVGPTSPGARGGLIALAGADLGARIVGGRRLPVGRTHRLVAGDVLAFARDERGGGGARCYLAVSGGFDVPIVLGSRSTCLPGGFGGLDGRQLRAGDLLASAAEGGPVRTSDVAWPSADDAAETTTDPVTLRILPGIAPGWEHLVGAPWRVGMATDRVGIRLEGAALPDDVRGEAVTHGVPSGAIQVPPDGRPIILGADHQTTGGYRVPAVVIRADLPLVGQLAPGDEVRFDAADLAAADAALAEEERWPDRGRTTRSTRWIAGITSPRRQEADRQCSGRHPIVTG